MTDFLPPTIDPIAAQRWQRSAPATTPWLHDEVGQRMQQRLDWIAQKPRTWCHGQAVRVLEHALPANRFGWYVGNAHFLPGANLQACFAHDIGKAHFASRKERGSPSLQLACAACRCTRPGC